MTDEGTQARPLSEEVVAGPCCACGRVPRVLRNVVCLPFRVPDGPERIGGWGCVVCHLPCEGAVAFVCDACLTADAPIKTFVLGDPRDGRRRPVEELTEPWRHDLAFHPEVRPR